VTICHGFIERCYIVLQDRASKEEVKTAAPEPPKWTRDSIYTIFLRVAIEKFGTYESKALSNSKFVDDLGADSLDIVELIMAVEDEFNIEIPDEEIEKILTVQDAVCYLCKKLL
jgi:acyl carrier protein